MTIKTLTVALIRKMGAAWAKTSVATADTIAARKAMKLALRLRCSIIFIVARSRWQIIALLIAIGGDAVAETTLPAHLSPVVQAAARLTAWSASLTALTNLYYDARAAARRWNRHVIQVKRRRALALMRNAK